MTFTEADLVNAVLDRLSDCPNPRFKAIMTALITHLHGFVRDVELTEEEWMAGINFLTRTGRWPNGLEFILLSDILGVSMLVDAINHRRPSAATESTVLGPFYLQGVEEAPMGTNIAVASRGEPCFYSGRVLSLDGQPLANAILDVWSGDGEGRYEMQLVPDNRHARGKFRTGADGKYWFRSIKPKSYPLPTDGPAGEVLRGMGRDAYHAAHLHLIVSAPSFEPVTTHLFVKGDRYIHEDAVFSVKDSLVVPFERHQAGTAPDGHSIDTAFYTAQYDFRLAPV